ncbi:MAG: hypothetical protein E6R07_01465 [Nevskiaceae bacterium]|nr:MAG: hypothetical protein E6R07_01465 [Nevskiaceae bacterium]
MTSVPLPPSLRRLRAPLCGVLAVLLAACAGVPAQESLTGDDLAWVRSGAGMLGADGDGPLESTDELMRVTPEMQRFADDATRAWSSIGGKSNALANALAGKSGLQMRYDAAATLTAAQAFEQHRANCLSYTLLYVALARKLGIPAQFNEVDIPPAWGMGDERTSLLYRHINARVDLNLKSFQIVDVSRDEYDPRYPQRLLSDAAAQAQFFNNRAVELRLQGQFPRALRYQLQALALAPDAAYLWSNLAGLYLAGGNLRAAHIAVARALQFDGEDLMTDDMAAQVFEALGQPQQAAVYHDRAQRFVDQNPYYHYQLALAALDRADEAAAFDETRRAIQLYDQDARFFFLMALLLDRQDQPNLAARSLRAALSLADDPAQQDRYRSKFARLRRHG